MQADEGQDAGGSHRARGGGGPVRLDGPKCEECEHQYRLQLCLHGTSSVEPVFPRSKGEEEIFLHLKSALE